MVIHFCFEELYQRRVRVCEEFKKAGFTRAAFFRQETDYYLTGYDTSGNYFKIYACDSLEFKMKLDSGQLERQLHHLGAVSRLNIWWSKIYLDHNNALQPRRDVRAF